MESNLWELDMTLPASRNPVPRAKFLAMNSKALTSLPSDRSLRSHGASRTGRICPTLKCVSLVTVVLGALSGCGQGGSPPLAQPDSVNAPLALKGESFPAYVSPKNSGLSPLTKGTPSNVTGRPIWYNSATGEVSLWSLDDGANVVGAVPVAKTSSTDWDVVGVGDFNSDGQPDIVWRNQVTGKLGLWLLAGAQVIGGGSLPTPSAGWQLRGIGDFDGDKQADILWENSASRALSAWKMSQSTVAGVLPFGTKPVGFSVLGVGDATLDSFDDIYLREDSSGNPYFIGITQSETFPLTGLGIGIVPPATAAFQQICDINGDGYPDFVHRDSSTSEVGALEMKGVTPTRYQVLATASAAWKLVGCLPGLRPPLSRSFVAGDLAHAVFDPNRKVIYASNRSLNQIEIYDCVTHKFRTPISVGSVPEGLDLTADGKTLVVCCSGTSQLNLIDVNAAIPVVNRLTLPPNGSGLYRPMAVVCMADNRAFVACRPDPASLLQVDLASLQVTEHPTLKVSDPVVSLSRSQDRSRAVFTPTTGGFRAGFYQAQAQQWTETDVPVYGGARILNNGGYILGRYVFDSNQQTSSTMNVTAPGDFTFDFAQDKGALLFLNSDGWNIGQVGLNSGLVFNSRVIPTQPRLIISGSGSGQYYVLGGNEIAEVNLGDDAPPELDQMAPFQIPAGTSASLKIGAADPEGAELTYSASGLPSGASLNSTTGILTWNSTGLDFANPVISVSDGQHTVTGKLQMGTFAATEKSTFFPVDGLLTEPFLDRARGLVYVSNWTHNRVERFQLSPPRQLEPIMVGSRPMGLDLSSDGSALYVCNNGSQFVEKVDLSLPVPRVVARFSLGATDPRNLSLAYNIAHPSQLAVTVDGLALVRFSNPLPSNGSTNQVHRARVLNLKTGAVYNQGTLSLTTEAGPTLRSSRDGRKVINSEGLQVDQSLSATSRMFQPPFPLPRSLDWSNDALSVLVPSPLSLYQVGVLLSSSIDAPTFATWNGSTQVYAHSSFFTVDRYQAFNMSRTATYDLPILATGKMVMDDADRSLLVICKDGVIIRQLP